MFKYILGVFGACSMLCGAAFAAGSGQYSAFMNTAGGTSQPIGHYEFCKTYRTECRPQATVAPVQLTDERWAALVAVNDRVNAAIKPAPDMEIWGRPEVWSYPDTVGDCEDYVLLKRRTLIRQGWPASSLLITVVRQTNGDGHAVLTVRTHRGDFVLDNLEAPVTLWSRTPYLFVKRQTESDSGQWVAISDDRPMLVGSVK